MTKVYKPIRIQDATLHKDGKRIENYIHVFDKRLRKYFKSFHFYAEYDHDLSKVPLGILNIPALSAIVHFAWAVGADLEVGVIDDTYLHELEKVRQIFAENPVFSSLSLSGELTATKTVKHYYQKTGKKALLFSGGLDSLASYIHNQPDQLITIWGLDIPTYWTEFWGRMLNTYKHLPLTIVKSNTHELYKLNHLYKLGQDCPNGYHAGYRYSIITFGLCPPATVGKVDTVMMASTYPMRQYGDPDYPFQNQKPHHIVDRHLKWANLETFDVETDCNRPEKIERYIIPYFKKHGPSAIRVCGHREYRQNQENKDNLNCSRCDKCERIIATLCNYGIDPNLCSFTVDDKTFPRIKKNIINQRFHVEQGRYFWGELKKHINFDADDMYGSKAFLEWLEVYKL